jgi:hypothetical protein
LLRCARGQTPQQPHRSRHRPHSLRSPTRQGVCTKPMLLWGRSAASRAAAHPSRSTR